MAQVAFNLKLDVLCGIAIACGVVRDGIAQLTAKLFIHHIVA